MYKVSIFLILVLFNSGLFAQYHDVEVNSKTIKDGNVEFSFKKNVPGSYFVFMKFDHLYNSSQPSPSHVITGSKGYLFTLRPLDKTKNIKYSYKYRYMLGKPIKNIDSLFTYLLPFKNETKVVSQSLTYIGEKYFGQKPPKNYKTFLFIFNNPEPIFAVRKGVVVQVERNYNIDTTKTYSFSRERNNIMIEHKDGTFAKYTGFNKDKIFVKVGDVVHPNSLIGELDIYDEKKLFQLRLSFFFLNKSKTDELRVSYDEFKSNYEYLNPYFLTTTGVEQLKPRQFYTTKISEEIITKEFKRRERKKWKKAKRKKNNALQHAI